MTDPDVVRDEVGQNMFGMIHAYWTTQLVRAAAHYSLADYLHVRPMTAEEFAASESLHSDSCFRFLRACAGIGLVRYDGTGKFGTTQLLDTLRSDNPQSLRGFAIALAAPGHWLPWGQFTEVLKTGLCQTLSTLGFPLFDYYATRPDEAEAFSDAMGGMTAVISQEAALSLDLRDVACVVDVGGAGGSFLFPILRRNPNLLGVIFDLPNVTALAEKMALDSGLQDQISVVGGDFFVTVPPGDLFVLKHILHDWDDETCHLILRNCRRAAKYGDRVVIIEMMLGEVGESGLGPLLDVNMMTMLGGRERTVAEYSALLDASGFKNPKRVSTDTPMLILEATAD